jgi:stress response protein YsnF
VTILVEATVQSRTEDERAADQTDGTVLPLLAEEVAVSKHVVETGRIQVARVTHEREQLIDELLTHETVEIDRTSIGPASLDQPARCFLTRR